MSRSTHANTVGAARAVTGGQRAVDAATTRLFRLPPRRGGYAVTSSIPVPARDGARLLTEHFAPDGRALWYRDWAIRDDPADLYWRAQDATAALDRVQAPVRLIAGWQDVFLGQTLEEYRRLRDRGVRVALTVGPWTHFEMATRGGLRVFSEVFDWVDRHTTGNTDPLADESVAYHMTGGGGWRTAPDWPPPTQVQVLYLAPGGALLPTSPTATAPPVVFTYDPEDPTPTVGGRTLSPHAGYQQDSDLPRRPDTVALVSRPLREPLEIVGVPQVTLAHRCDNPHFDVWVRISEVRPDGRSRNVTEAFQGAPKTGIDGRIGLQLDPAAHRFAAGSRIGLLIAGGSFPRYARNLGTPGNRAEGTDLAVSRHVIALAAGASTLSLPVRRMS